MIEFRFVLVPDNKYSPRKNIKDYKNKYPDILYICGEFTIIICDDIYFNEPQFPVIEFLSCLESWVETKVRNSNMNYVSIETEENPLISFVYENG